MRARTGLGLLLALALSTGCKPRTEIVLGVATELPAPGKINRVTLTAYQGGEMTFTLFGPFSWRITGTQSGSFNIPGTYGLYAPDGGEKRFQIVVTGCLVNRKNNEMEVGDEAKCDPAMGDKNIVIRKAVLTTLSGKTLFVRLDLSLTCINAKDCGTDYTCIDGGCAPSYIDPKSLPEYQSGMEKYIFCGALDGGLIDTSTCSPGPCMGLPLAPDAGSCAPGQTCTDGICYKTTDGGSVPAMPDKQVGEVCAPSPPATYDPCHDFDVQCIAEQGSPSSSPSQICRQLCDHSTPIPGDCTKPNLLLPSPPGYVPQSICLPGGQVGSPRDVCTVRCDPFAATGSANGCDDHDQQTCRFIIYIPYTTECTHYPGSGGNDGDLCDSSDQCKVGYACAPGIRTDGGVSPAKCRQMCRPGGSSCDNAGTCNTAYTIAPHGMSIPDGGVNPTNFGFCCPPGGC